MKIRNGFVSNSSSSSFIIVVKGKDEVCPICGHCKAGDVENIKFKLEQSSNDDTEWDWHTTNTADALSEVRTSMWITEGQEEEWELDLINKIRKYGNDNILMGSISNHDSYSFDILDHSNVEFLYKGES